MSYTYNDIKNFKCEIRFGVIFIQLIATQSNIYVIIISKKYVKPLKKSTTSESCSFNRIIVWFNDLRY